MLGFHERDRQKEPRAADLPQTWHSPSGRPTALLGDENSWTTGSQARVFPLQKWDDRYGEFDHFSLSLSLFLSTLIANHTAFSGKNRFMFY